MPIKIASLADTPAFCAHVLRFGLENGLGGVYFSPFSAKQPRSLGSLERQVRERWDKSMAEPGCERALLAFAEPTPGSSAEVRVVGHLDFQRDPLEPAAHRLDLAMGIESAFRGQGIGTSLMSHALSFAKPFGGISYIDLRVFRGNDAAIALYRKFGFVETGLIVDQFRVDGRSLDEIRMSLKL